MVCIASIGIMYSLAGFELATPRLKKAKSLFQTLLAIKNKVKTITTIIMMLLPALSLEVRIIYLRKSMLIY